jgi:hypothetical protein
MKGKRGVNNEDDPRDVCERAFRRSQESVGARSSLATVRVRGDTVADLLAAVVDREPDFSPFTTNAPPQVHRLLRRCVEKTLGGALRDIGDTPLM